MKTIMCQTDQKCSQFYESYKFNIPISLQVRKIYFQKDFFQFKKISIKMLEKKYIDKVLEEQINKFNTFKTTRDLVVRQDSLVSNKLKMVAKLIKIFKKNPTKSINYFQKLTNLSNYFVSDFIKKLRKGIIDISRLVPKKRHSEDILTTIKQKHEQNPYISCSKL